MLMFARQLLLIIVFIVIGTGIAGLAYASPNLYATGSGSAVYVIDTATNTLNGTIATGEPPEFIWPLDIAVNPAGTRAYMANYKNNTVSVIDTAAGKIISTIPVTGTPYQVAVNPDGTKLYMIRDDWGGFYVIDLNGNNATKPVYIEDTCLGFSDLVMNPAGTRLYITDCLGNVITVDTVTDAVINVMQTGGWAYRMAMNSAGTKLYVATHQIDSYSRFSVIDTATNTVLAAIPLAVKAIAINPEGTRLYVVHMGDDNTNYLAVFDTATNNVTDDILLGSGHTYTGLAVNPAGTGLYMTDGANDSVLVFDTATNKVAGTIRGINGAYGLSPIMPIPTPAPTPTPAPAEAPSATPSASSTLQPDSTARASASATVKPSATPAPSALTLIAILAILACSGLKRRDS
jgi:YVTN family beta-propeller protein